MSREDQRNLYLYKRIQLEVKEGFKMLGLEIYPIYGEISSGDSNFSIISPIFTPEYSQKYFNNLHFSIYLKNM